MLILDLQQLGEKLGKGAFGTVYKSLSIKTGDFVAIKRLSITDLNDEQVESLNVNCRYTWHKKILIIMVLFLIY